MDRIARLLAFGEHLKMSHAFCKDQSPACYRWYRLLPWTCKIAINQKNDTRTSKSCQGHYANT
jgi:hypothetical protein